LRNQQIDSSSDLILPITENGELCHAGLPGRLCRLSALLFFFSSLVTARAACHAGFGRRPRRAVIPSLALNLFAPSGFAFSHHFSIATRGEKPGLRATQNSGFRGGKAQDARGKNTAIFSLTLL
jgi:hypothetical protein